MNANSLRPRPTSLSTRRSPLVSPLGGLRSPTPTININHNVNGADRLQQPDSTKTGADHGLRRTRSGSITADCPELDGLDDGGNPERNSDKAKQDSKRPQGCTGRYAGDTTRHEPCLIDGLTARGSRWGWRSRSSVHLNGTDPA